VTREDLAQLYRLQEIDSAIVEREALLAELDDGTSAQAELDQHQAKLEHLQGELHQQRAEQRNLELELKGVEEDKREKHSRAYGGMVSDPKELAALERKLEELERNKERLEDRILALLDDIEAREAEMEQHQQATDQLERRMREIATSCQQQTQRTHNELEELRAKREELAPTIDVNLLGQYDELRQRLGGVAIVAVVGGMCTGCNLAVPRSTEVRARHGNAIVKCESCRRMLYFPLESK